MLEYRSSYYLRIQKWEIYEALQYGRKHCSLQSEKEDIGLPLLKKQFNDCISAVFMVEVHKQAPMH
jgi:hypothetical protein